MTRLRQFFLMSLMLAVSVPVSGVSATADDEWVVTDQQVYSVDGQLIALSPDGNWLAGPGNADDFCIWSLPELEAFCDETELSATEDTIAWAPDSSAVAFSHDPARLFRDSDIQIFDVASKEVINLTDDPDETRAPDLSASAEDGVNHGDAYPVWTTDSASILFVRGDFGADVTTTEIMSVDIASGEISSYFVVTPNTWLVVYSRMFVLPDGSLLITIAHPDPDNGQNGLWLISPGGNRIDPVGQFSDDERTYLPTVVDVSADGTKALVVMLANYTYDIAEESPFSILDLETGQRQPIFDTDWNRIAGFPQFVADSHEIVYPIADPDAPTGDIVVGQTNPYTIAEGLEVADFIGGIQWSDSNKLLIRGTAGNTVVLTMQDSEMLPVPCGCTPPPVN